MSMDGTLPPGAFGFVSEPPPRRTLQETAADISSMPILHGDGVHDDTEAFQALCEGKPVLWRGEPTTGGLTITGPIGYQVRTLKTNKRLYVTARDKKLSVTEIDL